MLIYKIEWNKTFYRNDSWLFFQFSYAISKLLILERKLGTRLRLDRVLAFFLKFPYFLRSYFSEMVSLKVEVGSFYLVGIVPSTNSPFPLTFESPH